MAGRILFPSRGFLAPQSFRFILLLSCITSQVRAADPGEEHYFNTHFQDECQFIVETICADLAGMFYFTKNPLLAPEAIIAEAEEVFRGILVVAADIRIDYEEKRWIGVGAIRGRIAHLVFTEPEPEVIRVISLRKATRREIEQYEKAIEDGLEAN